MSKRGSREHYDEEFQREAVRLLLTSGKTVPQVARELGISSYRLRQWKQDQLKATGEIEVAGQVRSAAAVEQENRQLRRELEAMRRQRDLLKKAIAICSEDGLRQEGMGAGRVRGMK
jgi:transposase